MSRQAVPPSVARNLEDGRTFDTFVGKAKLEMVGAGELIVPSGRIAAGDPAYPKDVKAFGKQVGAGRYPVILTMAQYKDKDQRIAAARVVLGDGAVARWQEARPGAYGIDSGLGCYVDADAAARLAKLSGKAYERYWGELERTMEGNYADTRSWGSIIADERSGANLMAFTSGFGEGGCSCYEGYDGRGRLVCVLTDFELLLTKDEIEEMDEDEERERPL